MASMVFYKKAVALDRKVHQNLRVRPAKEPFGFARRTNSVLLAHTEFAEASHSYPIVFVGKEGGPFTAAAVVGLQDDDNLMVDAQGRWEPHTYVPAFVRRCPFVLATGEGAETFTVCVDESYGGLNTAEGDRVFDTEGKETPYLTGLVAFLQAFHADALQTSAFVNKLLALNLLDSKVITVEQDGQKINLEGLWLVDEVKLMALGDADVLELMRAGYMGLIYAHLLSLKNVVHLARRQVVRKQAALDAIAQKLPDVPGQGVVH